MAKKEETPQEPKIMLDEFMVELKKSVEIKGGFVHQCREENIGGHKARSEWQELFNLFETKPTAMTWTEWVNKGGN